MQYSEESTEQRLRREEMLLRGDATSKYLHLDQADDIRQALDSVRAELRDAPMQQAPDGEDPELTARRLKMEETVLQEFLSSTPGQHLPNVKE